MVCPNEKDNAVFLPDKDNRAYEHCHKFDGIMVKMFGQTDNGKTPDNSDNLQQTGTNAINGA